METVVLLKALTPEARAALGGEFLELRRLPFRVGRESRRGARFQGQGTPRRRTDTLPNNDLYLIENEAELNVSREHFQIEARDGAYILVDRGSTCGTLVEGCLIGGQRQVVETPLKNCDVIIVGSSKSQFVFKLVIKAKQNGVR
jgi:pSer/pThr/pTyr-binding forkhead associated (FHA) protein